MAKHNAGRDEAKLEYLGDILGSLTYLGQCARCSRQFASTHDRVAIITGQRVCERCAK